MLVLISGWRNSGKDLTASHLVKEYGYQQLSFAGALKDLVATTYNIPRASLDDRVLKETPLPQFPIVDTDAFTTSIHALMAKEHANGFHTPRSLAILEGSIKRSVNPNYWVDLVASQMATDKNYVISDWRYRSEFAALEHLNPITIRIDRFDTCASTDASERDLDHFLFDHVIQNRSSLTEFYNLIIGVMNRCA